MNFEENKAYWEQYVTYWDNKVKEANCDSNKIKDKAPADRAAFQYFNKLNLKTTELILDYGCGGCRIYPHVKTLMGETVHNYYGVDIAQNPLNMALKKFPELDGYLKTTIQDDIPYETNFFDKIFCFGVFDACPQEKTLYEILRTLKIGGLALITGKNANFFEDDDMALVAEINARKKKHPNFFTDLNSLLHQLSKYNVKVEQLELFERRGDMVDMKASSIDITAPFYEYCMILKKEDNISEQPFQTFSNLYSNTYLTRNNKV